MTANKNDAIRILLVDDHPVVRDGIKANLEDAPDIDIVGEAATGEQALRLASELKPDIVIMDMKLPDITGLEATERLRDEVPEAKVLVLSMFEDKNYVLKSVRCGARGYVLKDSPPEDLIHAIEQVHKGGAFFDASVSDYLLNPDEEDTDESGLTPREREVLTLVAEGLSNKEIAAKLFLSVRTIEAHRENIMRKLNIHGTAALTRYAIEKGFVEVNIDGAPPSA